jgi:hypothetical protein
MIDLKKDYKDYLSLVTILCFGLAAFIYFSYDKGLQSIVIVLTAAFYVIWGIVHHCLEEDFHLKVLFEYLAVALLAVVFMLALLSR